MPSIPPLITIFSGFNQRATVAFLRTLKKMGLSYSIIALQENDCIYLSEYRRHIDAVRRHRHLDLDDIVRCIKEVKHVNGSDSLWIAPSTEALNRFLLMHSAKLEELNCVIPLVDEMLYCEISDKYSFCELCSRNGILVPKQSDYIDTFQLPLVAKPYTYYSKDNSIYSPQIIMSGSDKTKFIEGFNIDDFYFQEFIEGNSFYLLYYFDSNGNVYKYSQQNIAQQSNGKSILAAIPSDVHELPVSLQYESVLKSLSFRGLIMIEIRNCAGQYYMIEANPRFWGPSQLFVDANVNFFEAMLFDYGISQSLPDFRNPAPAKYYWGGGFKQIIKDQKKVVLHTKLPFEKSEWEKYDIYNRSDTLGIYEEEVGISDAK